MKVQNEGWLPINSQKWPSEKATYIMLLLDLKNVPITEKNLSSFLFYDACHWWYCVFLIYKHSANKVQSGTRHSCKNMMKK
jgi:hypothetical protein